MKRLVEQEQKIAFGNTTKSGRQALIKSVADLEMRHAVLSQFGDEVLLDHGDDDLALDELEAYLL